METTNKQEMQQNFTTCVNVEKSLNFILIIKLTFDEKFTSMQFSQNSNSGNPNNEHPNLLFRGSSEYQTSPVFKWGKVSSCVSSIGDPKGVFLFTWTSPKLELD